MVAATPTKALEIRRASRGVHSPLPPPHPPLPAPPPLVVAPVFFLPLPQKEGQHVPALTKAMGRQPKQSRNDDNIPGKGSNIPSKHLGHPPMEIADTRNLYYIAFSYIIYGVIVYIFSCSKYSLYHKHNIMTELIITLLQSEK